jgi:hypothetical protein
MVQSISAKSDPRMWQWRENSQPIRTRTRSDRPPRRTLEYRIASQRTAERAGYVRQEATADHRIFNGETREMVVYEAVRP